MGALSIRNIRKSFGTVEILKGIDIEVEPASSSSWSGPRAAARAPC
jgi:multiple sugar transport system ATP-binding protein